MQIWRSLYLNWLILIASIIIVVLLWTNTFEIKRPNITDTVQDSTLILRAINFILTAEIFFTISTFYGACVWFIIHRHKKELPVLDFYDGGYSLLSTIKGVKSKSFSIKALSLFSASIMIASYILDIYYIDSISYEDITSCRVQNTTIDMMPSSLSSLSSKPASSASIFYAFGSRIAELPYKKMDYTDSYTIPAIGNIDGLKDYTTIQFNVSVECQNPKVDMAALKNDTLMAQSMNGTYLHLEEVNGFLNQMIISPGHFGDDYNEIFISSSGFQKTKPVGVAEVHYYSINVSIARCQTRVTYNLINDMFGWGHGADFTSAKDISKLAQRASFDMFETLGVVTTKTVHSPITEWLTNSVSISTNNVHYIKSDISMSSYQSKLTMIAIEYLKGSGINGSMNTLGNYCLIDMHMSHISQWYKIIFTLIQFFVFLFLIIISFILTNERDTLLNDTPTLLRYICNNNKPKI